MLNPETGQGHDDRRSKVRDLIASAKTQTARANRDVLPEAGSEGSSSADRWRPAPGAVPDFDPLAVRIPGYDLLREIHRGGQGVVYEAFQRSTRRRVAVKVMREGPFAGNSDRARFDREVQLLASLSHPNIVAIHDSGRVAGHDYFVMDYIDGRPLDRSVASSSTSSSDAPPSYTEPPALVRLFVKVCNGINAAHLRGVMHRDLKPGNILVDADGEPHILDFGLAKQGASTAGAANPTMTVAGQFVGSLPWSSPEQAQGSPVDVRTDVYSLGVLLHQCLTGRFPYPVEGTVEATLESIRLQAPVRLRSVSRRFDPDLETIVLKCLSKDRERRYQSAGELARDLERFLRGEPVEARRESALYVLRKTLRRYRLATALACGIVLLAAAFAVAMAVQSARVARERDRAELQHRRAERIGTFLRSMFESVAPEGVPASEVSLRTILDDGAARLEVEFVDWPEEAAAVHETLGDTYDKLGYFTEGETQLRRSLEIRRTLFGDDHPLVFRSLSALAMIVFNKQDLPAAEALFREAIRLGQRVLDPRSDGVLRLHVELAALLSEQQRFVEAEPIARQVLRRSEEKGSGESAIALTARRTLARCLNDSGRTWEALPLLRTDEEIILRTRGTENVLYEGTLMIEAEVFESLADIDEAERLLRRVITLRERRIGDQHPALAWNLYCLGRVLFEHRGRTEEPESLVRRAMAIQIARKGPRHADVLDCERLLARILQSAPPNDVRPSATE